MSGLLLPIFLGLVTILGLVLVSLKNQNDIIAMSIKGLCNLDGMAGKSGSTNQVPDYTLHVRRHVPPKGRMSLSVIFLIRRQVQLLFNPITKGVGNLRVQGVGRILP